jgi:hypothetical protein
MRSLQTARCRFKEWPGARKASHRLRRIRSVLLALALPIFVVVFVGLWAGEADAGEPNAGGAPAWAASQPQSTPPVFSATVHVLPSTTTLRVGERLSVRVDLSVSEGCRFPIYELTLDQDPPLLVYTSPSTATVGPPVSNPFTYTLTAVKPGRLVLNAVAYGERYCGDYWNWRYLRGASEPVTVRAPHRVYLPLLSRPCMLDVRAVDLWPEPPGPLDRRIEFTFGASISYAADCETIAKATAFCAYPGETIPGCREGKILPDRPFATDEKRYPPGEHISEQEYRYAPTYLDPGFDRLVVRVQVREPWPSERRLYCKQEVYALTP